MTKCIYLIKKLLQEKEEYSNISIPSDKESQFELLRALMNIRWPNEIDEEFLKIQDEFLKEEINKKGIVSIEDLSAVDTDIYLWQGDITRLKCDAIVNAANSQMRGCFAPNHGCIDNAIHTYAGIQLRLECDRLMKKQGHDEPTGKAKLTKAYNLPSNYIIHTVGPIIYYDVKKTDEEQLRSCYKSCLELALKYELKSIAFCCISTGEFRFPNNLAAQIAVECVREFLDKNKCEMKVIFNVFKNRDYEIYNRLFNKYKTIKKSN